MLLRGFLLSFMIFIKFRNDGFRRFAVYIVVGVAHRFFGCILTALPVPEGKTTHPVPLCVGFKHFLIPYRLTFQIHRTAHCLVIRNRIRAFCGHTAALREKERLVEFSHDLFNTVQLVLPAPKVPMFFLTAHSNLPCISPLPGEYERTRRSASDIRGYPQR